MLPSRAFRNTGVPPALRSLITPHASLPASVAVQLRFRLGVLPGSIPSSSATSLNSKASFSTSSSRKDELSKGSTRPTSTPSNEPGLPLSAPSEPQLSSQVQETTTSQPLPERVEPRLSLTFTCTVPNCGERSTHEFSKRAYERGIVLVQCPGCQNRHLIADHLGWFKEGTNGGKMPTVEDILKQKGEKVRRGIVTSGGDIEFTE